jgi:D-alanine-D-alanine ligase
MQKKIKVGILFGGPSREREISFLGGKTAFENMDKRFFEPIPLFVDSLGNIIKINVELMYEKDIRSFYPSRNQNRGYDIYIESLGELSDNQLYKLIYKIGTQVKLEDLKNHIDFAFTIMHGPYAEDGNIQGVLEWLNIPYMGPGILGSAIGIDKPVQNHLIELATGQEKKFFTISKKHWKTTEAADLLSEVIEKVGFPFVVKAPHQGSSIGVAIVKKRSLEEFQKAMSQCFFEYIITAKDWNALSGRQKKNNMQKIANLDEGIGFPVAIGQQMIHHPAELLEFLNIYLKDASQAVLSSLHGEDHILIEEFITGQEFSCGVIQDDDGKAYALPPSEVYGDIQTFDFKSKYKSNVSKKRIPVLTSDANLKDIHAKILMAFESTSMSVISRIDGFLTPDDVVILHDPNTIPGMSPASFIFKQLAEVGFNITQSITYFIRQSIRERIRAGKNIFHLQRLLDALDQQIAIAKNNPRKKIAIVFGENENEYKVAQSNYGKFAATTEYEPVAVCNASNGNKYQIPVNLMFKPDILEFGQSVGKAKHSFIQENIESTATIRDFYIGNVDFSVKKLSEMDFLQSFDSTFDCAEGKIV